MSKTPSDFNTKSWIYKFLPAKLIPYALLARLDRPIGIWLLFLPCSWGLLFATQITDHHNILQNIWYLILFYLGSVFMRGAGCTYNDIIDKPLDCQVTRTNMRPLACGDISIYHAWLFLALQCFLGLIILLQFNSRTILLGILSLIFVALYPFMKRITWWPQLFLGLTFNFGILMSFSIYHPLTLPIILLYLAGIFWTIGYDTIYAYQDYDDDSLIGIKSTARLFGIDNKKPLYIIYSISLLFFSLAAITIKLHPLFWCGWGIIAGHFIYQIHNLDTTNPVSILKTFKSNCIVGIIILFSIIMGLS